MSHLDTGLKKVSSFFYPSSVNMLRDKSTINCSSDEYFLQQAHDKCFFFGGGGGR